MPVSEAVSVLTRQPPETHREPRDLGLITRAKFALVRAFLWGWARLFSLRGLYLFGRFFGTCEWLINYRRRRRFRRRLLEIFGPDLPPARTRTITRNYFMRTRCDKLFYLIFDKLPRHKILNRVRFHGEDVLRQALARGRGAYVALSHYGSHHVAGLLMALMGYKVAGVRDPNEGAARRYIHQRYAATFPEYRSMRIFYSDTFPRQLYRAFEQGCVVGSALDIERDRGSHLKTMPVRIFGRQREFLTGTMQIALRVGAPILQGFVISRRNFYFRLVVIPLLMDPPGGMPDDELLRAIMQRYAENIEAHVREYPDHISRV